MIGWWGIDGVVKKIRGACMRTHATSNKKRETAGGVGLVATESGLALTEDGNGGGRWHELECLSAQ